jgi:predicted nucleic acid-binding protein
MSDYRKLYWDTTCFVCFLNDSSHEIDRHYICEDILTHAEKGTVEIWTSSLTLAEVVRPREKFIPKPFPGWTSPVLEKFPTVEKELRQLWDFYTERTRPTRVLTAEELVAIQQLLDPRRIKTAQIDDRIANSAVAISRTYGLKPADAIHAATAIDLRDNKRIEVLQHWDRGYDRVKHLVPVECPERISPQGSFPQFVQPIGKPK